MLLIVLFIALSAVHGKKEAHFDKCDSPIDEGTCNASVPRYGYDAATGACKPFTWGGCDGNANKYETQEQCETATATCPNRAPFDKCNAALITGKGRAAFHQFGYDAATGACRPFIWGGMDGNANKYETHEQCETATATCPNRAPFDKCNAALIEGKGRAGHHRFGYDAATGTCRPFTWGGMDGNANNYETQEECETATASCPNRAHFDECNSPIDKGTCNASVPRYGYDAAAGACKPFTWGGCDGNANKYETQEQCETATATCPNRAPFDKCNAPILAGPCKEPIARYGYDAVTGTCKPFTYGGCDGNENRYETHEKCENTIANCPNKAPFDKCYAAIAPGPCNEAIEKYGYNVVTGACQHFTYGGCAGNANRYELLEDCEIATADCTNTAHFDKCNSPIDKGTCNASVTRYGYDAAAGACKPFTWGGCDGNANKYGTQEQCETATATCPNRAPFDKCNAALIMGYGGAAHRRFGYDATTGACRPFIWGGVGGNANRFETKKECETATASCPNRARH